MTKMKQLTVYECPNCNGAGRLTDWHYANQFGTPVGFSRAAAERQARLYELAYPACSRCQGRGFITKPNKEKDHA